MLFTDTSTNIEFEKPDGGVGCGNPICLAFGEIALLSDSRLVSELSLLGRSPTPSKT